MEDGVVAENFQPSDNIFFSLISHYRSLLRHFLQIPPGSALGKL